MKKLYLKHEQVILNSLRIAVGIVFLLSAIGKMLPSPPTGLALFESKTLIPSGVGEGFAPYLSRMLVLLELMIGMMLLKKSYFVPGKLLAKLVLYIFTLYLMYDLFMNGNREDCGCFGSLFSMSTRSSITKNIILSLILNVVSSRYNSENVSFSGLRTLFYATSLSLLLVAPFRYGSVTDDSVEVEYSDYFSDLGDDLKVLCFFSPDCEHCKETGRKLGKINNLPDVRIVFADESSDLIPEFYKFTGLKAEHKVISLEEFAERFFIQHDVPGVLLIEKGHPIHLFDGTEGNTYNDSLFRELINLKETK